MSDPSKIELRPCDRGMAMGIYDRDYYRESPSRWWGNPGDRRGVIALIAITVSCAIANEVFRQPSADGNGFEPDVLVQATKFYPPAILQGQVWRFVTSFLVGKLNFLGLIFGMFGLYIFGGELEQLYGTRRFVVFYLMAGFLSCLVKFGLALADIGYNTQTSGAAGPLFATFVLFAFHFPHRQIRIFFLLPIPVWVLVAIYLGLNLLGLLPGLRDPSGGSVPYLIDPLFGALVGFAFFRTRGTMFDFELLFSRPANKRRSPASLKMYDENAPRPERSSEERESPEPRRAPQATINVDEHLEAKLDAALAKVARQGRGSLTADENEILLKASAIFKKRRG